MPYLPEDQCKPRGDQSNPKGKHLVDQALTPSIIIDSPDNKVTKSLRRVKSRRSSPSLSRQRQQSRQQGRQEPKESPRSQRSTSLEVHIGDIKER
ncbi:hypothetical protein TNCV_4342101 [Trichonephila clavipes]|nr:hypothetical protein TNCV_4342101 [Trichonephila clavipes]